MADGFGLPEPSASLSEADLIVGQHASLHRLHKNADGDHGVAVFEEFWGFG